MYTIKLTWIVVLKRGNNLEIWTSAHNLFMLILSNSVNTGGDDWQRHVLPCCHVLCIFLQNREDLKCKNLETQSNFVCLRKVDNYGSKGTLKYLSPQARAVA